MFHKFLGLAGRALKPIVIENNPNQLSQHICSDAMFIRHVQFVQVLNVQQLLKLSIFTAIYGSPDLSCYYLAHYDNKIGINLALAFLAHAG